MKTKWTKMGSVIPIAWCVAIVVGWGGQGVPAQAAGLKVRAEPVTMAQGLVPTRIVVSPDGHHIAFVSAQGSRVVAVIDGKPSGKYDEIGHLDYRANKGDFIFSADGKHVVYQARRGDEPLVVVDGQELAGYPWNEQFSFSPDGKRYAFVATTPAQQEVAVIDGKPGPACHSITQLQFSADGRHVAYVGDLAGHKLPKCLVMDGQVGPDYWSVRDFAFSGDGAHWAYIGDDTGNAPDPTTATEAQANTPAMLKRSHVVVDGQERAAYQTVYALQISADGHVGYTAAKRFHRDPQSRALFDQCVVLDTQVWDVASGHQLQWGGNGQPLAAVFSPDGRRAAWIERSYTDNDRYVIVNGKGGLGYKDVRQVTFSLDSQHVYYWAYQPNTGTYIVADDDELGPYQNTPNARGQFQICAGPGGKHWAFQAGDGHMVFVVEDGKPQTAYQLIHGPLAFSPDGEHLAYLAEARDPTWNMTPMQRQQAMHAPNFDPGRYMVLDGQQQRLAPNVQWMRPGQVDYGAVFSPDSKHVAYTDIRTLAVDGRVVQHPANEVPMAYGSDVPFAFFPDSAHIGYCSGPGHYVIDGEVVAGYMPITRYVRGYQPVLEPDGSVFFFATHAGDPVPPAGPFNPNSGSLAASAPLYRVTVKPGPASDFGTSAAAEPTVAPNGQTQQAAAQTNNTSQNQQTQQQQQQQTNNPSALDKAEQQMQKAKTEVKHWHSLFGH